jgi:hypothetical protein
MLEEYGRQKSGSTGAWEQGPDCPWIEKPARVSQSAEKMSWVS